MQRAMLSFPRTRESSACEWFLDPCVRKGD
jgi:hypothetical protein